MSEAENRSSQQLFLFGRELRLIGDNIDEEVRHRAGRRRSSYLAVVASPGIILSTTTAVDHTAEILRRVFRLLDVTRLTVVFGYIVCVYRTVRRHKDVPVI